jgi:Aconitase family (aconitate hydratase)
MKRQAEEKGLERIFCDAGLEWVESGCSMCVSVNGDIMPPGVLILIRLGWSHTLNNEHAVVCGEKAMFDGLLIS